MPTPELLAVWDAWLADRPPHVAEVARRFPPWLEYRYTETGQRAQIYSYGEGKDGRVTIKAILWRDDDPSRSRPGWSDPVMVFGLDPDHFIPILDERLASPDTPTR